MNKKIAIDIVLLPDKETIEICKKINSKLNGKIDFNNLGQTPHITLLMGVINLEDLGRIKERLSNIGNNFGILELNGKIEEYTINETGENLLSLEIEKNKDILNLFEKINLEIKQFLSYEVKTDMFFQNPLPEEISKKWVKGFEFIDTEKYSPHITLGIGENKIDVGKVYNFKTSKLDIFQLGNYCTCGNKLGEFGLQKNGPS